MANLTHHKKCTSIDCGF